MVYEHTCAQCYGSFQSSRPHSLYCSGKCRVAHARAGSVTKIPESVTPSNVPLKKKLSEVAPNKRMAQAIMALIEDRHKIVNKAFSKYATFFLGDTTIQLGLDEIIIGEMCYKLKK